jgi:hypothetical protein
MRPPSLIAGAILFAASVIGGLGTAPSASASVEGEPLNGTYRATSNGEWAATNDSFHDEATVRSTWTITSTCRDPLDCTGQVTSDQGWTAEISKVNEAGWTVKRDLPGWEKCADGTAATGRQVYRFWPADASGVYSRGSTTLVGTDKTTGPSGACGVNRWLVIEMPFKLVKIA